jgi:hypothetical protein
MNDDSPDRAHLSGLSVPPTPDDVTPNGGHVVPTIEHDGTGPGDEPVTGPPTLADRLQTLLGLLTQDVKVPDGVVDVVLPAICDRSWTGPGREDAYQGLLKEIDAHDRLLQSGARSADLREGRHEIRSLVWRLVHPVLAEPCPACITGPEPIHLIGVAGLGGRCSNHPVWPAATVRPALSVIGGEA